MDQILFGTRCLTFLTAYELNMSEGLRFERRLFHGLFATNDQKEGKPISISIQLVPLIHSI
jgi:hypothetical protein